MRERGWNRSSPPATGRAKSLPDAAVTNGVQRGATGTPTVTPHYGPWLSSQVRDRSCWCGGSRIRTLEGISRRIYRSSVRHLPAVQFDRQIAGVANGGSLH
jgi:hypothetical protein